MKDLFDLHRKHIDEKFDDLKSEINELKDETKKLVGFRWFVLGISSCASVVVSFLVTLLLTILGKN